MKKLLFLSFRNFLSIILPIVIMSHKISAQEMKPIHLPSATVKELFDAIRKHMGLNFIYSNSDIDTIPRKDYIGKKTVTGWLDFCLQGSDLEYLLDNKTISIRKKIPEPVKKKTKYLRGVVLDEDKKPLSFVHVVIKNTVSTNSNTAMTDDNGSFELPLSPEIQKLPEIIVVFSYVSMKPYQLHYTGQEYVEIRMMPDCALDEVVVVGIYERKKESFTGSSTTYKMEELKRAGNKNLIQSLKVLDPAFNVMENNLFGSDPNKLPDVEIRGKTSVVGIKEQFSTNPNQPLFILDGFETTLETVMDLNMARVASVTILKDAASTAIYGSKAANGVVVIETKNPLAGSLQLSYKGDYEWSFPDLSDYNLMTSFEKLEFEQLAGRYSASDALLAIQLDSLYHARRADAARGVDTYWMSEPLRAGINHKHQLYAEGGDKVLRYGIGLDYAGIEGVVKNSSREIFGGRIELIYRRENVKFSNKLSAEYLKMENPIVSFREFALANPYYRKTNVYGEIERYLERGFLGNLEEYNVQNPLWDSKLKNYDKGSKWSIRNNFIVEWQLFPDLNFRTRLGLSKNMGREEKFYDPLHSLFDDSPKLKKGKYIYRNTDYLKYEGDITVNYGKLFADKHRINLVGGWNISALNQEIIGFSTVGFNSGDFNRPSFSGGYPEGGKPENFESKKRATGFFFNGGYSYDNRYLTDFNYRLDGTSVFGANRKFTDTWSLGVAWNISNENFLQEMTEKIDRLKIRFSVGNPGNQNFDAYLSYTTYIFNEKFMNDFGNGVSILQWGNPELMWQKTLDKNIGMELSVFDNRLHCVVDFYHKKTDPVLARVNISSSSGLTEINTNMGGQINKGFSGLVKYAVFSNPERRINWTLSGTVRAEKGYFYGIGNSLDKMNAKNRENRSYERYYDGGSLTSIWAMRSAGIDPASGRELFITRTGETTFEYSYSDEVVVGNTAPKTEGVLGSSLYYKGFSFGAYVRYRIGGQIFNTAVYEKVENIGLSDLKYNQDRRALYDRWQKPGDIAGFKSIEESSATPMSSRFVMDENVLTGESFQLGYELEDSGFLEKYGISALTLQFYAVNLFRFSSVKSERGIDYPFARSFSMSLTLNF